MWIRVCDGNLSFVCRSAYLLRLNFGICRHFEKKMKINKSKRSDQKLRRVGKIEKRRCRFDSTMAVARSFNLLFYLLIVYLPWKFAASKEETKTKKKSNVSERIELESKAQRTHNFISAHLMAAIIHVIITWRRCLHTFSRQNTIVASFECVDIISIFNLSRKVFFHDRNAIIRTQCVTVYVAVANILNDQSLLGIICAIKNAHKFKSSGCRCRHNVIIAKCVIYFDSKHNKILCEKSIISRIEYSNWTIGKAIANMRQMEIEYKAVSQLNDAHTHTACVTDKTKKMK